MIVYRFSVFRESREIQDHERHISYFATKSESASVLFVEK